MHTNIKGILKIKKKTISTDNTVVLSVIEHATLLPDVRMQVK